MEPNLFFFKEKNDIRGGTLTLDPSKEWGGGSTNFAGDLGKGCKTINLVPFLALTLSDAGTEQEGDFQLRQHLPSSVPQPSSLPRER